ncbi:sensor histidine kinase [Streptomyces sp. NPDC017979]|uniref:sensor histidine kinase n=1 Tax=Streptomyces sp. NPDC017979 TaxID=3365024 RepID=UPI0037B20390
MPADVPLEEQRRSMTAGARDGASHVWERTSRAWDAYFAVVWVTALVVTLTTADHDDAQRLVAAGLLALLMPWYLVFGRPQLARREADERQTRIYVVGAVVLYVPPAAMVADIKLAVFALLPQCFMLLRMRAALLVATLVTVVPVVTWVVWRGPPVRTVVFVFLSAATALAFSAVFGRWIMRVIDQSRERAELIAELEARREELARLSAAHGALAERERMSREIHDTLAQGFTSLLMLVQAVEGELDRDPDGARRHLGMMAQTARQNLAEARALVAGGAPAELDGSSLPDALRRLAERHAPPARVTVTGGGRPLAPALELVALRACQEALANAAKHAGAGAGVSVDLDRTDDELRLRVHDTGRGFDTAAPPAGFGLRGLRARAAEVGGRAEVHSAPGRGTTVSVTLPIPPPRPEEGLR